MRYEAHETIRKYRNSYYLPIPIKYIREVQRSLNNWWTPPDVLFSVEGVEIRVIPKKTRPPITVTVASVAPVSPVVSVNTTPASKPLVPPIETLNKETGELTYVPYQEEERNG